MLLINGHHLWTTLKAFLIEKLNVMLLNNLMCEIFYVHSHKPLYCCYCWSKWKKIVLSGNVFIRVWIFTIAMTIPSMPEGIIEATSSQYFLQFFFFSYFHFEHYIANHVNFFPYPKKKKIVYKLNWKSKSEKRALSWFCNRLNIE